MRLARDQDTGRDGGGGMLLVEDRYAAKRTTSPLSKVCLEPGMESLYKGAHKGDLESRTCDGAFPYNVGGWEVLVGFR